MSRIEQAMTRAALVGCRDDRDREDRLSVIMGAEERRRVESALLAGAEVRTLRETAADNQRAVEYAVTMERRRCLAIAELWPDNLLAREIAKRIAGGAR